MNKFQKKLLFTVTIFLFVFFLNILTCNANLFEQVQKNKKSYTQLLNIDFADKTVTPWGIQANSGDIIVVPSPTDLSKNVMKAHININEDFSHVANGAPRAEILNSKVLLNNDSEYLIEFKTHLPSDFQMETLYNNSHCFFQIHQNLMSGSPQLSLGIDKYNYRMTSNSAITHSEYKPVDINLGIITKDFGKWVEWTILYKPSYGTKGRVIIWKNGNLVSDYIGACAYNNATGYLKFGLYKWNWKKSPTSTSDIITYFSDIKVYRISECIKRSQ